MGPKTKAGLLVGLLNLAIVAFLLTQGTVGQVLAAFYVAALVAMVVIYVVLTFRYLRTGDPAWRP